MASFHSGQPRVAFAAEQPAQALPPYGFVGKHEVDHGGIVGARRQALDVGARQNPRRLRSADWVQMNLADLRERANTVRPSSKGVAGARNGAS